MKVVIAGIRYKDYENKVVYSDYVYLTLDVMAKCPIVDKITEVISGHAVGVDQLGEMWAKVHDVPVKLMPITSDMWRQLGKKAGPLRNAMMADECDAAIILWDGKSNGTRNMINQMIKRKKPYFLYMIDTANLERFYDE